MFLEMPTYIKSADADSQLTYKWGASQEEAILLDQPRLMDRVDAMKLRAALAFSLAAAEWVVWRVRRELPDDTPQQALQAAWASVIDWRYLKHLKVPRWEEVLPEPVGGPLASAFRLLSNVLVEARDEAPVSPFAVPLSEIPVKIYPDPAVYKEWRRAAIRRLTRLYPAPEEEEEDVLGSPVPREALDPSFEFRPNSTKDLLGRFLRNCDPGANTFLSTPEEMHARGFAGVPYSVEDT